MTTRRELIQTGVVLGAALLPGGAALAAGPAAPRPLTLHKAAYDGRTAAGRAFAAEARRLGVAVHDTRGDVTGLYADDLLDRWGRSPAPIAGLTNHASMFVLALMGSGAGLRLVWTAHHRREADGRYSHALFGPAAVRDRAGAYAADEADWARQAARTAARWPAAEATVARARSNIAEADLASVAPDTLVSWVLAPVHRT